MLISSLLWYQDIENNGYYVRKIMNHGIHIPYSSRTIVKLPLSKDSFTVFKQNIKLKNIARNNLTIKKTITMSKIITKTNEGLKI